MHWQLSKLTTLGAISDKNIMKTMSFLFQSLQFVPMDPIYNKPALVQCIGERRIGD